MYIPALADGRAVPIHESMMSTACPGLTRREALMPLPRFKYLLCLALLLGVPGGWLLSSYAAAYVLTRLHRPPFADAVPTVAWGSRQAFHLSTTAGEELGAWFGPGKADRPVVLLLHGNHGSRRDCLPQAEFLAGQGYGVMMISFRCHGDSTGAVNDFGYSARRDVVAAVRWLEEHQPGRPRLVWGFSLGAAAATFAAAELGERVQGYLLECPYRDLFTAVRNRTE